MVQMDPAQMKEVRPSDDIVTLDKRVGLTVFYESKQGGTRQCVSES